MAYFDGSRSMQKTSDRNLVDVIAFSLSVDEQVALHPKFIEYSFADMHCTCKSNLHGIFLQ